MTPDMQHVEQPTPHHDYLESLERDGIIVPTEAHWMAEKLDREYNARMEHMMEGLK